MAGFIPKNTRRKFDIKNDIFKVEKNPTDDSKLVLTINSSQLANGSKKNGRNFGRGYVTRWKSQEKVKDSSYNSFYIMQNINEN